MPDETKPPSVPEEPDKECQGAEEPAPTPVAPAPAAPAPVTAAPAKPAAPAAAAAKPPVVQPKPAAPTPQPWESELITALKRQYGSGIQEASSYLGQKYMVFDPSIAHEVLQILHDDERFDYCVDVTAVHYPKREKKEFDIIWILYSFATNERIRVKTQIADGDAVKSVVSLWPTANWLEREVFDMFGIKFEGHPDLRRILLPDEWKGYPLRKDYGIKQQDQEWVQINVGIQSGQ